MIGHLAALLLFQLAGEVIARTLDLTIPGPVIGMLLLLAAFLAYPRFAAAIRPTAQVLLQHLSLLFVPAGVGVVGHLGLLGSAGGPLLIAVVLSTMLSIIVGVLVFLGVSRLTHSEGEQTDV